MNRRFSVEQELGACFGARLTKSSQVETLRLPNHLTAAYYPLV